MVEKLIIKKTEANLFDKDHNKNNKEKSLNLSCLRAVIDFFLYFLFLQYSLESKIFSFQPKSFFKE